MEKGDVPSAKSLAVVDRPSDRLSMEIKNNSGPSMEPWGTPASILTQGDACRFKTTRCFLNLKKSVIRLIERGMTPLLCLLSNQSIEAESITGRFYEK